MSGFDIQQGEEVTLTGADDVPHVGKVKRVYPSGSTIQNGRTGERCPGMKVTIQCKSCERSHQLTSPALPSRPLSEDRLIPTLAMTLDPRLRRLFALAGKTLHEGDTIDTGDALYDALLTLAPEYVPPEEDEHQAEWERLVKEATR